MIGINLTNEGRNTYDNRNNDDETNIVLGFIKKKPERMVLSHVLALLF